MRLSAALPVLLGLVLLGALLGGLWLLLLSGVPRLVSSAVVVLLLIGLPWLTWRALRDDARRP